MLQTSLQLAASAAKVGFWSYAPADGLHWDESLYRLLGLEPAEHAPALETVLQRVHPEDQHILIDGNRAMRENRDPERRDIIRWLAADGSLRWFEIHRSRVRDTSQFVGLFQDITERHNYVEAIKQSEARLALATSAAGIGIWEWDLLTGTFVYSAEARTICGFSADQILTFADLARSTHPEDFPLTHAQSLRARDPQIRDSSPYKYRIIRPDGEVRHVIAHGEATFEMWQGTERAVRYTGTLQDVTDQRQLEEKIASSSARLQLAIQAGRMAAWDYDYRTDTVKGSPELNRLMGYPENANPTAAEFRSRHFAGESERLRKIGEEIRARGEKFGETEYRIVWPDGSIRWLLIRAELTLDAAGNPIRAVGVLMDITDRKSAEENIRLLVNEVNHRSKNLLAVVQSIAKQTAADGDPASFVRRFGDRLQSLAASHDLLIQNGWRGVDLAALARSQLAHLTDLAEARMALRGPPLLLKVSAAQSLGMAFHELATNASKYGALSSVNGKIAIEWAVTERQHKAYVLLRWVETGGPKVTRPERRGFGSLLITDIVAASLDAKVTLDYGENGLSWSLEAPLESIAEGPAIAAAQGRWR